SSLLPESPDPSAIRKRNNTLAYCSFLRKRELAWGTPVNVKGESFLVPWMRGVYTGELPPDDPSSVHGDEY
ncbi:hypothetical protein RCK87_27145, partial [Salmonella enterica subsp. enterica serovar 1,4,[5],12:i:-]